MLERDLIGYGATPVHPQWPDGSRIAVQFVINYEEGGERSVLYGDDVSEAFLTEEPTRELRHIRNLNVESQFEYGSRSGFWRLYRIFCERNLPVTVFGVSQALATNPQAVAAMKQAGWEIACHGLRWVSYAAMPEEEEQRHIEQAVKLHAEVTGEAPLGWYTGRMSVNTRRLIMRHGGFLYDSDSFADDLPYWVRVENQPHLVVPYTLDNNDGRYVNSYGFQAPNFSDYLIQAFDLLYREGLQQPKMMSIGLHARITGKPGRAADLERFLDHITAQSGVWVSRRVDIARHWHQVFAP